MSAHTARSPHRGYGLGFGQILFIVFLVLRLIHQIDWSWWWVTAPLWIPLVFMAAAGLIYGWAGPMRTIKMIPGYVIGIGVILFIVFLVLRLIHQIDWSWWWVTAALWVPLAFLATAGLIYRVTGRNPARAILLALLIVLFTLTLSTKLLGQTELSWWDVTAPIWAPLAITAVMAPIHVLLEHRNK